MNGSVTVSELEKADVPLAATVAVATITDPGRTVTPLGTLRVTSVGEPATVTDLVSRKIRRWVGLGGWGWGCRAQVLVLADDVLGTRHNGDPVAGVEADGVAVAGRSLGD